MYRFTTLLTLVIFLVGCSNITGSATTDCVAEEVIAYGTAIETKINRYERQADLVASTPRIGIATPLQTLLDIQLEIEEMSVPPCTRAHFEYVKGMMDAHQIAYQNFAAQGDDTVTTALIMVADDALEKARAGLPIIKSGVLPPTIISEDATKIRKAIEALGYELQVDDIFDGKPSIGLKKDDLIIGLALDETGTVQRVSVHSKDRETIAKIAQAAIPTWTDAAKWITKEGSLGATRVIEGGTARLETSLADSSITTLTVSFR